MSPDLLTEEEKDNFLVRDGLFFPGDNETQGRLNTLDYETAWVSWEWVSKQIEERYVGELCSFF